MKYMQGWKRCQQEPNTDGYAIEHETIDHSVVTFEDVTLPNPSTARELEAAVDKMLFFPPKRH